MTSLCGRTESFLENQRNRRSLPRQRAAVFCEGSGGLRSGRSAARGGGGGDDGVVGFEGTLAGIGEGGGEGGGEGMAVLPCGLDASEASAMGEEVLDGDEGGVPGEILAEEVDEDAFGFDAVADDERGDACGEAGDGGVHAFGDDEVAAGDDGLVVGGAEVAAGEANAGVVADAAEDFGGDDAVLVFGGGFLDVGDDDDVRVEGRAEP